MAQTGYTPILVYASGTATNVPLAINLTSSALGAELALNYADGKLYYKNSSGTVTLLASTAGASGDVVGPASATDNALARFDLTTGKLIQNSVGILSDAGALSGITDISASGSITLSGGTANGVAYLNGSKVLTTGSALVFDGSNLGIGYATPTAKLDVRANAGGSVYDGGQTASFSTGGNTNNPNGRGLVATFGAGGPGDAANTYGASISLGASSIGQVAIQHKPNAPFAIADFYPNNIYVGSGNPPTPRLTMDMNGNFGIGTTSPVATLDVVGAQINPDTSVYASAIVRSTTAYNATPRAGIIFSVKYNAGGTYAVGSSIQGYKENSTDGDFGQGLLFTTQANGAAPSVKMLLDSLGKLGVGTTTPITNLSIGNGGGGNDLGVFLSRGVTTNFYQAYDGTKTFLAGVDATNDFVKIGALSNHPIGFVTNNSEKARINADGVLQVGRTGGSAPDGKLQTGATGTGAGAANTKLGFALIEDDSGNGAGLWLGAMTNENTGVIGTRTASGNLAFQTYNGGWGERARITYQGNLLIGTTANVFGARLNVIPPYAAVGASFEASNSTYPCIATWNNQGNYPAKQIAFHIGASSPTEVGSITSTATATSYVTSSDYRLKNTITPMTGALAKVAALKPVAYKWNVDGSDGEGFIAHELAEVCPHAVTGEKDAVNEEGKPVHQGVDYGKITPLLTAALQEAIAKIELLEARLASLESK